MVCVSFVTILIIVNIVRKLRNVGELAQMEDCVISMPEVADSILSFSNNKREYSHTTFYELVYHPNHNLYFTLEVMPYQIQFLHNHLIHSPNLMPHIVSLLILFFFQRLPPIVGI